MMNAEARRVDAEDLFDVVSEGDRILIDGREDPLTVYRHVTEDDHSGQVITMKAVTDDHVKNVQWEVEHGDARNDVIQSGDLITMSLTGDEFLIARGPRGGCYLLKQWWSKEAGRWTADVSMFRRTREDNEVWAWENTVSVEIVGHEDVDREDFDEGGDWVRHTEVDGVTVWSDTREGVPWVHSEALTGCEPRVPSDGCERPLDALKSVSEGDTVTVEGVKGEVTEVREETDGVLADGLHIKINADGMDLMVRTFTDRGEVVYRTEDGDGGDVTNVST